MVCYSKDGNYFAAGDNIGKFFIFDSSENLVQSLQESLTGITRCRFSYDNKYLAFNDNTRGNIIIYTTNCLNTPTCQQGFYASASSLCLPCSSITGCLSCSSSTTCTACVQGFFLNGNSCASCTMIPNCKSCESSSKCTDCRQGSVMDYSNNTCTLCDSVIGGCISCERNSTNPAVFCRACLAEFYLNSTDLVCYPCVRNLPSCKMCTSPTLCIQCLQKFYLDASNACRPCIGNCLFCTSNTSCIACAKGYYSLGGVCTTCSANCFDCNNAGQCLTCARGFFLNGGNCSACTTPCLACVNSAANCQTCALGVLPQCRRLFEMHQQLHFLHYSHPLLFLLVGLLPQR